MVRKALLLQDKHEVDEEPEQVRQVESQVTGTQTLLASKPNPGAQTQIPFCTRALFEQERHPFCSPFVQLRQPEYQAWQIPFPSM